MSAQAAERIGLVHGNVAEEHPGPAGDAYVEPVHRIDAIDHSGTWVNPIVGHPVLKGINVGDTAEIPSPAIRLRRIPVHHVSLIGEPVDIDQCADHLRRHDRRTLWRHETLSMSIQDDAREWARDRVEGHSGRQEITYVNQWSHMYFASSARVPDRIGEAPPTAMTMPDVRLAVVRGARWLVVDDKVVDVGEFLDRHPGGRPVLLAGLGRDVTAEFEHVSAHDRGGVARQLRGLVISRVQRCGEAPAAWAALADHVLLVRNGLLVQDDPRRSARLSVVYLGQSHAHLVAGHLTDFEDQLRRLDHRSGRPSPAGAGWVEVAVQQALQVPGERAAAALATTIRRRSAELLDGLLALITHPGPATAGAALAHIDRWKKDDHGC